MKFVPVRATKLSSYVASVTAANQVQQIATIVGIMTVIEVVMANSFHKQNVTVVHHLSNE